MKGGWKMATAIEKFQSRANDRGIIRLRDGSYLELIAECDRPYIAHMRRDGRELIDAHTPAKAVRKFRLMADHGDFIS
jgi:hypothetical protein